MNNETITPEAAAAALNISVGTLRRRVASGEIASVPKPAHLKRFHRLLFYREEIEKLATPRSE